MANEETTPRFTNCHAGCGARVEYKFCPRVVCEKCRPERRKERYRRAAEVQRRKKGVPKIKGTKFNCQKCGVEVVRNRSAIAKYCKECYVIANSESAPDRAAAKRATKEGREYHNEWARKRRKSDPSWRVAAHLRILIGRGLKSGKQGKSWREFVPYTLEELMTHLERQFIDGMSWDNRREWHIDHIVPQSSFEFEGADDPEFQAAWALTNLRPIWAKDNLRKSAKRTHLI